MPALPSSNPGPGGDTEEINPESSAQRPEPGIPGDLQKELTPLSGKELLWAKFGPLKIHMLKS